jgi:hypothetical protein
MVAYETNGRLLDRQRGRRLLDGQPPPPSEYGWLALVESSTRWTPPMWRASSWT